MINFEIDNKKYCYNGTSIFFIHESKELVWQCKARDKNNNSITDIKLLKNKLQECYNKSILF